MNANTMTTLADVERAAMVSTEMTMDELFERRNNVLWALYRLKEYVATFDAGMIEWMQANDVPEIIHGDKAYKLTNVRAVKRRTDNAAPIFKAVLEATGGDLDEALHCLSTNAMKQSAVKKAIGEDKWRRFYAVEYDDQIKIRECPKEML